MTDTMDTTDKLLRDLALADSGWRRVEHPETGVIAMFPVQAKDVAEWERRCSEMHAEQKPISVEPKPIENYADHVCELRRS